MINKDRILTKLDGLNKDRLNKSGSVLILNFGSQYTQLIARCIRKMEVYCEVHPHDIDLQFIEDFNPSAIILSGGFSDAAQANSPSLNAKILNLGIPILGICYGMQIMARQLGGETIKGDKGEFGLTTCNIETRGQLLQNISDEFIAWMSHNDHVNKVPSDFKILARSGDIVVAIENNEEKYYGLQFHPEVTHTECGMKILENFVFDICSCNKNWKPSSLVERLKDEIYRVVGNDTKEGVLLALSGGVDSSVLANLLHNTIGDRLICVFVNNGMLRAHEVESVLKSAQESHLNIHYIDASAEFLSALQGISDPEKKRKVIGVKFIEVFQRVTAKLNKNIAWLAQGTIYSDVIESAVSGDAETIKSHHNVGGLPEVMNLKLLEPMKILFKDEVRALGRSLNIASHIIDRHPFPGPGLAVRIIGEVKDEYLQILRVADHIFIQALQNKGMYHDTDQAFAVLLPIKSVGVKGDARSYGYTIALRAVNSVDFMTATPTCISHEVLQEIARKITNEIPSVTRVVYDISSKPPATIEWE
ncbi:MAG: glutamine-hydrolyzing GMP synthase [Proteobacteria bacterium]|nr:glutamine-hydrolyzing GMP synthase [Pseudomonadota bacterium]